MNKKAFEAEQQQWGGKRGREREREPEPGGAGVSVMKSERLVACAEGGRRRRGRRRGIGKEKYLG